MKKALICLAFLMFLAVSPLFAQPLIPQLISPMPGQPDLPPQATELVWMQPDHTPDYWFQVYLSLDPGFPEPPVYEGPAMEFFTGFEFHFPAPELLPLQTYNWKIRVTDLMSMLSSESDMWFFLTAPLPLEPPQLIYPADQATDIPTGGIDLVFHLNDWQYNVDSFFDIFLDIDPNFPNPEQFSGLLDPDRMDFHYYVPALLNAQTYYWYVRYHHPVENYVLDSQVYSFLTGTYIVPSSTIRVTLTNNSSYTGTWAYVTCTGACAPWTRKMTFGTTYNYLVNNGLNPIVTPTLPVASPSYFFSPYPIQFNNIQSNQTANFTLNTLLPPPVGNPVPIDLASNVSINIGCLKWNFDQWTGYGTPDAFAVYFPAYEQTPYTIIPYTGKRTEYLVPIPTLAYGQDYTWKVVPYNTYGEAENVEIWTFSTQSQPGPPVLISPADGEQGVSAVGVNLQFEQPGWVPDSFFDVFCDLDPGFSNPPAYSGPLTPVTGNSFEFYLAPLIGEQDYYWKVRYTSGPEVWDSPTFYFATGPSGVALYNLAVTLATTLQFPSNYWLSPRVSCVPACIPTHVNIPLNNSHNFKVPAGLSPLVTPYPPGPFYYFVPGSQLFPPLSGNQSITFTMYSLLPGNAVNPIPGIASQNVAINTGFLRWSYLPNSCYAEPDGFKVYFPADNVDYVYVPYVRDPDYELPIGLLEYGYDYTWKVVPFNIEGEAEFVEEWYFSTETEPDPFWPSDLYIYPSNHQPSVEDAGLIMFWGTPDEGREDWPVDSFFDVWVDIDPDFSGLEPIYSGPGLISPLNPLRRYCHAPQLQLGTLYYWRIRLTLTGTMEEHYSPIWDFITQDTQLVYPPPILVSPPDLAEAVPPRHVPFVWEMPMYPPDSFFDVFVSIDPAFPEPPIYTGPGIPVFPYVARWVYEHPLLLDEEAYYWYVRVNDLIDHWYRCSDVWEFTTGGYLPPEPPILVSPLNGAEDLPFQGVDLEWQTDPDWWVESFFDVFCDIDPSFPAPPVYSGTGTELLVDGIFVFNQANLLDDEAYHWYVRITDVLTELTSVSPVWTFTTAGGYLPPPDISIDAEGVLHWLPVDGADGYRIYRSFDPGIDFTAIHVTTELFWADPEYLTLPKAFYYVTAFTLP